MRHSPRKLRSFRPATVALEARNAVSSFATSIGLAATGLWPSSDRLGEAEEQSRRGAHLDLTIAPVTTPAQAARPKSTGTPTIIAASSSLRAIETTATAQINQASGLMASLPESQFAMSAITLSTPAVTAQPRSGGAGAAAPPGAGLVRPMTVEPSKPGAQTSRESTNGSGETAGAVGYGSVMPLGSGPGLGGGEGSGTGGGTHHITLYESGGAQGYTDINKNVFNQIGGAEEIAFTSDTTSPVTSVVWTITGGAYSGIDTSRPDHSGLNPQTARTLNTKTADSGEFYWNEKPGAKSVTANVTYADTGTATATINVTVQTPTLTSITRTYQGVSEYASGLGTVTFKNAVLNAQGTETPGEIFTASIRTDSLNADLPGSYYYFTQLVTPAEIYVTNSRQTSTTTGPSTIVPMLDNPVKKSGSQLYGGWITKNPIGAGNPINVTLPNDGTTIRDSPSGNTPSGDADTYAANGVYATRVAYNNTFKMFLMFQPPGGIQSAIGEVDWTFAFNAVFNAQPDGQHTAQYYTDPNNWTLSGTTPTSPGAAAGAAVNLMPQWLGWYLDDRVATIT